MSQDLPPRYDPQRVEEAIYARWESTGAFRADPNSGREPFTISIPPPNVTGVLHMGHALNNTLQDVVIRYQRMRGKEALWVPGTDHAGIATQAVVEKSLYQDEGKTREQVGREEFLRRIWAWRDEHGGRIIEQLKRMGCSCDWERTAFTMEEDYAHAVREAFVRLFEKGLIYRGARLVNWDCTLETAVSDDEIEYVPRKSHLWYLRYPVEGQSGRFVVVATTRPETMLGDTGVAVHPEDERYRDLVGRTVRLPLVDRQIPVVADETVSPEFGTGAVKVTPGHDPEDYQRGQRHDLQLINLFTRDGHINEAGGAYEGLSRDEARERVVQDLEAQGLLEKIEDYEHSVSISDRSKSVIEPLVSEQWFVRMEELAQPAIEAVRNGTLRFVPERWSKVYLDWLENVRDWCISRQLWWGHRIPVWYDEDDVPVASREDLEIGAAHPGTGKPIVRRDPDVMDTWASSWLWPMATLGWPSKSADLGRFYPTQFLSTAREIIYLWVARMVMAGYEFLPERSEGERCPFSICYIHATVLDDQGRRMAKSLGNGIDPLDLIRDYGADAMRLALMLATVEGQDIKFSERKCEETRNFVNKLWNAARFVLSKVPDGPVATDFSGAERLEDRWILTRLRELTEASTTRLEKYRFHDYAQSLRRFTWNEFCDWYLEIVKVRFDPAEEEGSRRLGQAIAAHVLRSILHLLHPVVPFVTEEIFEKVRAKGWWEDASGDLIRAPWPATDGLADDAQATATMQALQELVVSLRNLRARNGVSEQKKVQAALKLPDAALVNSLGAARSWFERLSRTELLGFAVDQARPDESDADVLTVATGGTAEVFLSLAGLIDKEARAADLEKKIAKIDGLRQALEGRLANSDFTSKAPPAVVEKERGKLAALDEELEGLRKALAELTG